MVESLQTEEQSKAAAVVVLRGGLLGVAAAARPTCHSQHPATAEESSPELPDAMGAAEEGHCPERAEERQRRRLGAVLLLVLLLVTLIHAAYVSRER